MKERQIGKCSVKGCFNKKHSKGFCAKHYAKWKKYGDPTVVKQCDYYRGKKCKVDECGKEAKAKEFCFKHYNTYKKYGDPKHIPYLTMKGNTNCLGLESKNTKKAIKFPTLRDIEWAAGFCEGEACFTKAGRTQAVLLPQTRSREPLQKMLDLFGGTIRKVKSQKNRKFGIKGKASELWSIHGSRARGFMMTVYTLMSPRRQKQIRKALDINGDNHVS